MFERRSKRVFFLKQKYKRRYFLQNNRRSEFVKREIIKSENLNFKKEEKKSNSSREKP